MRLAKFLSEPSHDNGYFYFILVGWLIVRRYIRECFMKNHEENVPSFFFCWTQEKEEKRPIDVADRLSIERGAADVQVRVR